MITSLQAFQHRSVSRLLDALPPTPAATWKDGGELIGIHLGTQFLRFGVVGGDPQICGENRTRDIR